MAAPSPIMNQPAKTPHISRIDQPTHRTHGFFLRVSRDGHIYSAFFADQTYGGREQALAAAQAQRGKLLNILGLPAQRSRRLWAELPRRRGRSGIVGVQRVIDRKSKPWRKYWRATWSPRPGVVRKQQFSIREHGEERAKQLALRARRAGLRSMVD